MRTLSSQVPTHGYTHATHITHPVTSRTYHHALTQVMRRGTDNTRKSSATTIFLCKHFFNLDTRTIVTYRYISSVSIKRAIFCIFA